MEFLINFAERISKKILNGKEYYVARMTLIVPGVLNGSSGNLYYPHSEVSNRPSKWNGIPLVLDHPNVDNTNVSIKYPGMYEKWGLGTIRNARFKNNKLIAEGWFDVEKTKEVDSLLAKNGRTQVLPKLLKNQTIELSTGLFTKNVDVIPSFDNKGRSYSKVATNYIPDHVAILPDKKGACSREDGCGVLVNKHKDNHMKKMKNVFNGGPGSGRRKGGFTTVNPGHIRTHLTGMGIDQKTLRPPKWFSSDKDHVISSDSHSIHKALKSKGYKSHETTHKGVKTTTYTDEKTRTHVSIHDVPNKPSKVYMIRNTKEISMKTKLIKWLTANCDCWKEKNSTAILNKMSEESLKKLVLKAKKADSNQQLIDNLVSNFSEQYEENNSEKLTSNNLEEFLISLNSSNQSEDDTEEIEVEANDENEDEDEDDEDNEKTVVKSSKKQTTNTEKLNNKKLVCSKCNGTTLNKEGMCSKCGSNMSANSNKKQSNKPSEPMTEKEWLDKAPPRIRSVFNSALNFEKKEKASIISVLTSNIKDKKRKEVLTNSLLTKTIEELQMMLELQPKPQNNSLENSQEVNRLSNYFGSGGSNNSTSETYNNEVLEEIEINWNDE